MESRKVFLMALVKKNRSLTSVRPCAGSNEPPENDPPGNEFISPLEEEILSSKLPFSGDMLVSGSVTFYWSNYSGLIRVFTPQKVANRKGNPLYFRDNPGW